jgi:hypothetical protein
MNGECYTGTPGDTLSAFGASAKMGLNGMGMAFICCCILLFAYISTTATSKVPLFIAACCVCSLIGSLGQYLSAKSELSRLKTSGKLKACAPAARL